MDPMLCVAVPLLLVGWAFVVYLWMESERADRPPRE